MPLPFRWKKSESRATVGPSARGQHHGCCCHVFRNPWETTAMFGCTGVWVCKHVNTYGCRECRLTSGVVPGSHPPLLFETKQWLPVADKLRGTWTRSGAETMWVLAYDLHMRTYDLHMCTYYSISFIILSFLKSI